MAGPAAALGIDVVANITEAQAALAKVQAQLEATAATSESAAAKSAAAWTAAGKKMQTVGKSMTKYITVPAVAAGAVAVKLAADFDKSMALIQTQAGASASEVKKLSAEVLAFAKSGKTQFSPNDLAQALYSIESAGIHGAKAMDTLKASAKLATVGQADLASTTKALAAAQKTGIKGSADLTKAIGTLNATVGAGQMHMDDLVSALGTGFLSTAKAAGLSLTDVGTALDELTKQGTPAAAAATRLRMTMSLIAAPTTTATAALKGIGLSATDMANAMRGNGNIIDALTLLQDHLDGLSHTQQLQVLTAAFGGGRSAGAVLALLGNLKDMSTTLGTIKGNTDQVNSSFQKMQEEPSVQLERVWSQMQAVLIDMGNNLIPKLIPLVQKIANVLNTVITAFTGAPGWVQDFLIGAVVLGPFIRGLGTIVKLYGAIRTAAAGAAVAETASASAGAAGGAGAAAGAGAEAAGGGALAAALPPVAIGVGVAAAVVGLKIANDKLNASMDKAVKQGFQPEGLIHFGNAMDKVKAQIKKVHDATSGLQDARKNERDTAAAEAKAEQHLLDIRQKYGPDSKQAIKAEGQAARATDAHRIAVQKLQLADRLQGVERKIEERDLVRAAAQQRQQIESLRTQRQNILANVHATGIQNMSNKQLEMTQQRLDAIDKQTAQRQKDLNDLKQKAVQEIGPGYAKQLGVELAKQKNYSDQLKATSKSNQILNDATDSSTQHIHRFTGTADTIKKWSSDAVDAFDKVMKKNKDYADGADKTQKQVSDATSKQDKHVTYSYDHMATVAGKGITVTKEVTKANATMAKDVMNIVGAMVSVVSGKGGFQTLGDNVNSALKALGVSKGISFSIKDVGKAAGAIGGALGLQRGGKIVPGHGSGDKVPAMLEPGEFVLNREAVKGVGKARLESLNKAMPRFAKGGAVSGDFSNMHPAIVALATTFLQKFGGSMSSGFRPGDPGFHGRGLAADIVPSNWGGATAYANQIGSQLLEGIHQGPPGVNVSWDSGAQVSPSFWGAATWAEHVSHIHLATQNMIKGAAAAGAAVKKLKRVILEGPKGPLKNMGQAALDKVWKASNAFLAKHAPSQAGVSGPVGAPVKGAIKVGETISGKVSYFTPGVGAYGYGPGPGVALNPWPPTGWNDPRITSLAGHDWMINIGGHKAKLPLIDKGPAIDGRVIDVTTPGVLKLGMDPASFPTDSMGSATLLNQRGGLVPSFASGGIVPRERALMEKIWAGAAPYYGKSGPMPTTLYRNVPFGGALVGDLRFDKGKRLIWPHWMGKKLLSGDSGAKETLVHEWAHHFQRLRDFKGPYVKDKWEYEGGADAFARAMAPAIYRKAGIPYHSTPMHLYDKDVRRVQATRGRDWIREGQFKQMGGMVMPPYGGSFAQGGVVPGPIGQPRTIVAHGGETVEKKPARYQITITNWKQGTGYMEEIADGAVNGQRRLGNQLSRMSRA